MTKAPPDFTKSLNPSQGEFTPELFAICATEPAVQICDGELGTLGVCCKLRDHAALWNLRGRCCCRSYRDARSGSSCQPQHFFSSTTTGEEWGLEKGRRKSLGLAWPIWFWAAKRLGEVSYLRGCLTGCRVSVSCGRRLPLAIICMSESFQKQAPIQGEVWF